MMRNNSGWKLNAIGVLLSKPCAPVFVGDWAGSNPVTRLGLMIFTVSCALLAVATDSAVADEFDDIGLTQLRNSLGINVPTGHGIEVLQVEHHNLDWYLPNVSVPEFAGKDIVDLSGYSEGGSGHATIVGQIFYGHDGVAPGVDEVGLRAARDWYGNSLLRVDNQYKGEPLTDSAKVQNHSWIANRTSGESIAVARRITRLLDYMIARDQVTVVVTVDNGSENTLPDLLANSYNSISVGRSDGGHSFGDTIFDSIGRRKPEIVAPLSATSYAAPLVSGSVALLMQEAERQPRLAEATRPEVMKALLLTGATKEEFAEWTRDAFHPLDKKYGTGELNIYKSHRILTAGRQDPANPESRNARVNLEGWDANAAPSGDPNRYVFEIPEGSFGAHFSATLCWLREISDGNNGEVFEPVVNLADMDLRLYRVEDEAERTVDESLSLVDNVEHLYQTVLSPGRYEIEVEANQSKRYGLAWRVALHDLPQIASVERIHANQNLLRLNLPPGFQYRLEMSQDFETWQPLNYIDNSDGVVKFSLVSAGESTCVYRVIPLP